MLSAIDYQLFVISSSIFRFPLQSEISNRKFPIPLLRFLLSEFLVLLSLTPNFSWVDGAAGEPFHPQRGDVAGFAQDPARQVTGSTLVWIS